MAIATLLHVGDDICRRIPTMERAGLIVRQSECSLSAVLRAFVPRERFSVITFHNEVLPPPTSVVSMARELSAAPIILFQNPSIDHDERLFDLVVPTLSSPVDWLGSLEQAIRKSALLQRRSRQLCLDISEAISQLRALRASIARDRIIPIDIDAIWRGEYGKL